MSAGNSIHFRRTNGVKVFETENSYQQSHPRERWNIGFVLRNMLVEEMA